MNIADAGITAIFGYVVVFAGLLILMIVISVMGSYFKSKEKATVKPTAEPVQKKTSPNKIPKLKKVNKPVARGSAGHVRLYDVPDKEAAMIMAIVADTMQKPINELHFISIREVK